MPLDSWLLLSGWIREMSGKRHHYHYRPEEVLPIHRDGEPYLSGFPGGSVQSSITGDHRCDSCWNSQLLGGPGLSTGG